MKTFISIRVTHAETQEDATRKAHAGIFDDDHELCNRVMDIDAAINVLAAYHGDQEDAKKQFLWKDKSGRGDTNPNVSMSIIEAFEDETNYDGESLMDWAINAEIGDEWENSTDYYIRTI